MLNQTVLLGALPKRFGFDAKQLSLAQYSELARGNKTPRACWRVAVSDFDAFLQKKART